MINLHHQTARHYHDAIMECSLLGEHLEASKYHQESALQYHFAALQLENSDQLQESIKHHYLAGIQYHNAALQFNILNDYSEYGKQIAESLKHKQMAKYGSDYLLPPNQQILWLADPQEVKCNAGLELVFKSNSDVNLPVLLPIVHQN